MSFGRLLCSTDLLNINFSIKTEHDFSQKLGSVQPSLVQPSPESDGQPSSAEWKAVRTHQRDALQLASPAEVKDADGTLALTRCPAQSASAERKLCLDQSELIYQNIQTRDHFQSLYMQGT